MVQYHDPGGHTASLVPGDLDQILDNLLANALDASAEDGRIQIELAAISQAGSRCT